MQSRERLRSFVAGLSPFAKFFIQDLLDIEPEKRPSSRELLRSKFRTEYPPESAETRPRKRKFHSPDSSSPNIQSELLTATLRWAASNLTSPQFFRALLTAGNVILPIYVPAIMQLGHAEVVKTEFGNANDAFMALQAALSAGDVFSIGVSLERIPDADELEDRIGQYVTLWSGYVDLMQVLVERNVRIHEHDRLNWEALYLLAWNSSYDTARTIA